MTFERPWILILCLLPVVWTLWQWRMESRRAALALKAAALLAVLLALAQPSLTVYSSRVALAILVDTSASVSPADLEQASEKASRVERARGSNWSRVMPFARAVRKPAPEEGGKSWSFRHSPGEQGRGTDLEAAVREAIATLPAGMVRRVALFSDGRENIGSAARAIWQAQQLGVPIDVFPLAGSPRPRLHLEAVSFPSQVFSGERFPIELTIDSPQPASAAIEIAAEHKPLGASRVQLGRGSNRIRVQAHVSAAGATDIAGRISAGELGEVRFENAVTLRRPRVLLISKDPPGTEVHLLRTLEANQFEVERAHSGFPASLADFQLVLFNNWDMESLALPQKTEIESFVKQGGGLLWIAGERNVYVEKPPDQDPLERALPARLAPPRTPEGTLVVLIIDKSSSMEGKKMELARLAAIGVVENLRPVDHVGVLIFDNSFQWAVPIRKAEDRSLIKRLIAGITPDGGTQIAPALAEAYRRALPQPAVYKHVVLLTDGISEEGDSISLAREASTNRITISSVGLGQDVNRAYLEKIASFSQGKSYFLNDPSGLEQILLRDVKEHTGSTAVEKPSRAKILKEAEILEGVGMESAPPLAGYIRFISKPTADTILAVDGRDPLFARWQFGLGRAAVFASDAKSRWAAEWVAWPGFDRFWANVLRDLLPHSPPSEAVVDYDGAQDELVVDYRFGSHLEEPARIPDIFALGPNGFRAPVKLSKMAAGHYRGRVPVENGEGLFRIRPLEESRAFPEAGFYRQEEELAGFGSDLPLLRRMAASTGGRLSPDPQRAFDPEGRAVERSMQLWPGLLALAILLNLAELVMRKWRGLAESLRIAPRPAPATAAAQVTSKAS